MPKFIQTDRIAVSDDAGNTVYVRRKMDMGARLRVAEAAGNGETLVVLYQQNILAWEGPDFRGVKCTPENIEKIDVDDPFWTKVGDKIGELNKHLWEGSPDPLAPTTAGETTTAESTTAAADSTTSK